MTDDDRPPALRDPFSDPFRAPDVGEMDALREHAAQYMPPTEANAPQARYSTGPAPDHSLGTRLGAALRRKRAPHRAESALDACTCPRPDVDLDRGCPEHGPLARELDAQAPPWARPQGDPVELTGRRLEPRTAAPDPAPPATPVRPPADATGPPEGASSGEAAQRFRLRRRELPTPPPGAREAAAEWLADRLPAMVVVEGGRPRQLSRAEKVERVARELPDSMVAGFMHGVGAGTITMGVGR